ncbi:vacuolar transporter chaperone [Lunasporangiospora selenospora]|uniref:Vacuolar transporter chaperone n=1 Tax=Lunasporangiospora selenospora TaxID=979761 RepID=A0A9P6KGK7_9FUNG|nr:vacuolar transporter chaperone [Lunasporangiospora selenospora]
MDSAKRQSLGVYDLSRVSLEGSRTSTNTTGRASQSQPLIQAHELHDPKLQQQYEHSRNSGLASIPSSQHFHSRNSGLASIPSSQHFHQPSVGPIKPLPLNSSTSALVVPGPLNSSSQQQPQTDTRNAAKTKKPRIPNWVFPRRLRARMVRVRHAKADTFGNRKAKFSSERTLVHWIKAGMLLGSLAMTLLSFGENEVTPIIGLALFLVCVMLLIYANTVYHVRMEWLNMRREDVKYYDRIAPTLLTIVLVAVLGFNTMMAITGRFREGQRFLGK